MFQSTAGFAMHYLLQVHSLFRSFKTTGRIGILHLDADLYSSYLDVLFNLYDLLEIGGYVVCDDCGFIEEAGRAVSDFRRLHHVTAVLQMGKSTLTRYWQKDAEVEMDTGQLLSSLRSFDSKFCVRKA